MPKIIGIAGTYAGRNFDFNLGESVMIGRDEVACKIVFGTHSKGVSRHHCVVKYSSETGMFVIYDVGSSYGTFLMNGSKIGTTPTAIRNGERFYLGSPSIMFEVRR